MPADKRTLAAKKSKGFSGGQDTDYKTRSNCFFLNLFKRQVNAGEVLEPGQEVVHLRLHIRQWCLSKALRFEPSDRKTPSRSYSPTCIAFMIGPPEASKLWSFWTALVIKSATKKSRPTKASVLDLTTAIISLLPREASRLCPQTPENPQLVADKGWLTEISDAQLGGASSTLSESALEVRASATLLCCDSDSALLTGL